MPTETTIPAEIEAGYTRLRTDRGLVDLRGSGTFDVDGPDAVPFLDELCTRSPGFLLEEHTLSALMLDGDGMLVAEVLLSCHGDRYTAQVWPGQRDAAWAHLQARVNGSAARVAVRDRSDEAADFAVEGPHAALSVQPLVDRDLAELAYKSFTTTTFQGEQLVISRTGVTAEFGYRLGIAAECGEALQARLVELGALPCPMEALDICRMESRFPDIGAESGGGRRTPFELGLQWMVDFEHDFCGREPLLQRWQDGGMRLPVCFTLAGNGTVRRGDEILLDGDVVGAVAHAVHSPGIGQTIGVAHLDEELAAPRLALQARGAAGDVALTTCSAPFLVPLSLGMVQR